MKRLALVTATFTTLAFAAACSGKQDTTKTAPPSVATSSSSETAPAAPAPASDKDIVETAAAAGSFKTLLKAAEAAGLVDALKAKGPITVFAPTDEAFQKLGDETIAAVLKDKAKLAAILKHHVVVGKVMAEDVTKLEQATMLGGKTVSIDTSNGVKIGNANVIKTDIVASNGVIHVIDTVLIPN